MTSGGNRKERDSMGEMEVPEEAYYGASTQRAVLNFPVSELTIPTRMIRALGFIKWAAAETNLELGRLPEEIARPIADAALEVTEGRWDGEFVVDVFQTGSGTSSNMNANEVIANRAAELIGAGRGARDRIHPNDHVNLGQSSNDVIPTSIHLAAKLALAEELDGALERLHDALATKAKLFWDVIKTGRTHLQDATPIRMGQIFHGYAGQIERGRTRIERAAEELTEVALGGTAVGTGLNTHPEFAARACRRISERSGVTIRESENHFQAQSTLDSVVAASGQIRTVALSLLKIAHDIRWMASGPRTGLGELRLPEVQPGSSIMPGKVNPVIAESAIQAAAQIFANDQALLHAGQWGMFELNTMLPLAGHNLLQAIELLAASSRNFAERSIDGLEATERGPETVEQGLSVVTGLVPLIGYDESAAIAKQAAKEGSTVREVARKVTKLSEEELREGLDPFAMTEPK